MSDANVYFDKFMSRWGLTDPEPNEKMNADMFALRVLQIAIIGSVALSGTRTGSMIGETEMFSTFIEALGWGAAIKPYLNLIEALFGLATFEAAIFIGGYLWRRQAKQDRNPIYYYIFIGAAVFPALVSNLGPAARLIDEAFFNFWLVVVNVVVGVCTIILAFIGGRVLEMVKFTFNEKFEDDKNTWLERRKQAWLRSPEYKEMRQMNDITAPAPVDNGITREAVIDYISKNGPISEAKLAQGLNVQKGAITGICKKLVNSGQIKSNRNKYTIS